MAVRIYSDFESFAAAAEEAGAVLWIKPGSEFPGFGEAVAVSRKQKSVVGHFTSEKGPVNLTDGVLADTGKEYLAYEG